MSPSAGTSEQNGQHAARVVDWPLVRSLHRREESAIDRIYAEYGSTVFGFLLRTLRDRAAAEDVQQQVFLEVWKGGPGYDPQRGGLLTWIMQIARNRAIDQLRRKIPEPFDPQDSPPTDSLVSDESVDELIDTWHMTHLLRQIPREEADLLRARFFDGKSQSEIAAETGVALGTVKMMMVRGLRRLRDLVEQERTGEPAS